MDQSTFIGLVNNVALLLSLALFYNTTYYKQFNGKSLCYQLFNGLVLGTICILLMLNPWVLVKGIVFDTRSILISTSGLFFGIIPTLLAVVMGAIYRFYLGGSGVWTGWTVMAVSGTIGLVWHYLNRKDINNLTWSNLYLFGVVVHISMLLLMFSLPGTTALYVLYKVGLPVILLYPLGTVFLGKLLSRQHQREKMANALLRSESLLKETQQITKVGGWEYNLITKTIFWTDEVYRIYGVSKDDYDPNNISQDISFYAPEDRLVIDNAFKRALSEGVPYDLTLRFKSAKGNVSWVRTVANVETKNGKITRVYGNIIDITESMQAKQALSESDERLKRALENIPALIVIYDPELRIKYINSVMYRVTGRPVTDFIGKREDEIWPPEVYEAYLPLLRESLNTHKMKSIKTVVSVPVIGKRYMMIIYSPLLDDLGNVREILGIMQDFTTQQRLEDQFRQAQKMEAVGRLAGGVAHDFNNLLFVIIGYTDMLREEINSNHPHYEKVEEILKASLRAKQLVQQLLAFSRKQVLETKIFNINEVLLGFESLLRRVIGEDIELSIDLMETPGYIKADVLQLEQVVMNLAVNAKDAMPNGGKLIIETDFVELDETYVKEKNAAISPGPYIMLSVSDNGVGMDAVTLNNIFEPFFTTKEPGVGTGLGLSTIYGVVKQHGGSIWVYSELNKGTTFKIYFPAVVSNKESESGRVKSEFEPIKEPMVILVAEDDYSVRKLTCNILVNTGYEVIEPQNAEEAINKAKEYKGKINLLLTDVIMPTMNGVELYKKIVEFQPNALVLYMSGYTMDVITSHGVLMDGIQYIQKPFSKDKLLKKIAEIILPQK